MPTLSLDLRKRILEHYDTEGATFASTARVFRVGEATVNRLVRLRRETGGYAPREATHTKAYKTELEWLSAHVARFPDARLKDRAADYFSEKGVRVCEVAVWNALRFLGITHKKRRFSRRSVTPSVSNR